MAVDTPSLDHILSLAHRLPREQRGQLIARLVLELTSEILPERPPLTPEQAHAAWAQLRADLSTRPPGLTSMAEQLDADRRSRDQALAGCAPDERDDVHA